MTKPARAHEMGVQADRRTRDKSSNRLAAQLRGAVRIARAAGPMLRRRSARAVTATGAGYAWTTRRVQAMPRSTSQSLAAGSLGLGAGLLLGGVPRLVAATGAAPAVVIGAAILMRPDEQGIESEAAG